MTIFYRFIVRWVGSGRCLGAFFMLTMGISTSSGWVKNKIDNQLDTSLPIRVNSPLRINTWQLSAERIVIGPGEKPSMAMLPDGELVMVALFDEIYEGKRREWTGMWRSTDAGKSWSSRRRVTEMVGREHWLTSTRSGILFSTCHLLAQDWNNKDGYTHSFLYRSIDRGKSWQRVRLGVEGVPTKAGSTASRNLLELPDGSLWLGVGVNKYEKGRVAFVWRSKDSGETWEKGTRVKIGDYGGREYNNWDAFFSEDFNFLMNSGRWLHVIRCGPPSPMHPKNDGRPVPTGDGSIDRMLWCTSTDQGQTWGRLEDFGPYAVHYPRLMRLKDGRVLLSFTQRGVIYPIGLQAIISYDDGQTWDFDNDRIIIEGKTPWGHPQGGGFGNTLELADGTLISCYSYRRADNNIHIEVVRWRLPPMP